MFSVASWFCIQCVFRLGQHLGISLLGLNALGHAACAILTYIIWWDKPQGVLEPEEVKVKTNDDEQMVAARTVTGKFGTRKPESGFIRITDGIPKFMFPVKVDRMTGQKQSFP